VMVQGLLPVSGERLDGVASRLQAHQIRPWTARRAGGRRPHRRAAGPGSFPGRHQGAGPRDEEGRTGCLLQTSRTATTALASKEALPVASQERGERVWWWVMLSGSLGNERK
jgi:hypothetical protein